MLRPPARLRSDEGSGLLACRPADGGAPEAEAVRRCDGGTGDGRRIRLDEDAPAPAPAPPVVAAPPAAALPASADAATSRGRGEAGALRPFVGEGGRRLDAAAGVAGGVRSATAAALAGAEASGDDPMAAAVRRACARLWPFCFGWLHRAGAAPVAISAEEAPPAVLADEGSVPPGLPYAEKAGDEQEGDVHSTGLGRSICGRWRRGSSPLPPSAAAAPPASSSGLPAAPTPPPSSSVPPLPSSFACRRRGMRLVRIVPGGAPVAEAEAAAASVGSSAAASVQCEC